MITDKDFSLVSNGPILQLFDLSLYVSTLRFLLFFHFVAFFNAKLINHNILLRNFFLKFFGGIRGFLNFDFGT